MSENDTSPEELFGGRWTKIEGRFLFASDSNHYVEETGGEEKHQLTLDEIPTHKRDDYSECIEEEISAEKPKEEKKNNYLFYNPLAHIYKYKNEIEEYLITETENIGEPSIQNDINIMPPYLVANCWKRIGEFGDKVFY